MKSLSLAMIVKNEEEVLRRCLNSASSLYNELIIVDTGSTDKTKEIAAEFNAKIYDFEWIDDFAAARNFSFSKCTSDYILWLDADDVVKDQDVEKIKKYLESEESYDSLLCRYIYAHDEKDNPILVLKRNRIVKNDKKIHWVYPIHECVTGFSFSKDSDIEVHHYQTEAGYNRKQGRNLKILKKLVQESDEPRHQWYYARELADSGQSKKAITLIKKIVKEKKCWEGDIINAYQKLANLYLESNQTEKAKNIII